MNLLDKTKVLLSVSKEPRREIAKNADVGFEWLRKFQAGEIDNPGVVNVQKLHDYLERTLTGQESAA